MSKNLLKDRLSCLACEDDSCEVNVGYVGDDVAVVEKLVSGCGMFDRTVFTIVTHGDVSVVNERSEGFMYGVEPYKTSSVHLIEGIDELIKFIDNYLQ